MAPNSVGLYGRDGVWLPAHVGEAGLTGVSPVSVLFLSHTEVLIPDSAHVGPSIE